MLKITIGPTPSDAKVECASTGEDLTKMVPIKDVFLTASAGALATARLYVDTMEVTTDAGNIQWQMRHPVHGTAADIAVVEFKDGTRVCFVTETGKPRLEVPDSVGISALAAAPAV